MHHLPLTTFHSPIVLIACGGNSERMGTDKSQLSYYGKRQFVHLFEMVSPYFKDIYFSIQEKQLPSFSGFKNLIADSEKYKDHGPISGLLSCYELHPERSIIYIGCDYPLLTIDEIRKLSENSNTTSAFFLEFYEPLLAFYSAESLTSLDKEFNSGNFSLQKFLENNTAVKILPEFSERISSVDTPEKYQAILQSINRTQANS